MQLSHCRPSEEVTDAVRRSESFLSLCRTGSGSRVRVRRGSRWRLASQIRRCIAQTNRDSERRIWHPVSYCTESDDAWATTQHIHEQLPQNHLLQTKQEKERLQL